MCKHCENLIEDKEIVHTFMETAAKNLSVKHGREISPDWLDVEIKLTFPIQISDDKLGIASRAYRMLSEMDK